jgi:hypothetical protein
LRGKNHSSHGGRKAYLNFELKDRGPPEAAALRAVLDFKAQIRSGQPCEEWDSVAGGGQYHRGVDAQGNRAHRDFKNQLLSLEPSVLSGFAPQSDKSVSRETFWYD